jgi:hypothetical protein
MRLANGDVHSLVIYICDDKLFVDDGRMLSDYEISLEHFLDDLLPYYKISNFKFFVMIIIYAVSPPKKLHHRTVNNNNNNNNIKRMKKTKEDAWKNRLQSIKPIVRPRSRSATKNETDSVSRFLVRYNESTNRYAMKDWKYRKASKGDSGCATITRSKASKASKASKGDSGCATITRSKASKGIRGARRSRAPRHPRHPRHPLRNKP